MNNKNTIIRLIILGFIALSLAGTKACQTNYEFGTQSRGVASGSPTESGSPSASATPDLDDIPEPSDDLDPSPSASASSSPTQSPSSTPTAANPASVNTNLMPIGVPVDAQKRTINIPSGASVNRTKPENWLGKSYSKNEIAGRAKDSDGDGYSDRLEKDFGSDPFDANSTPPPPVTSLAKRLKGLDDDADGLTNQEELTLRADPFNPDTDGDGCPDGAEVLSGSDPLDATSLPNSDSDKDCLSDDFEISIGLDPNNADTDGDGLRDDLELAIGSNPFKNDTDGDGILDGKEVELGSDPTIPEHKASASKK